MAWIFFFVFLTLAIQGNQASINHLGRTFNILHGLKPAFPAELDSSSVFYPVKKTKLLENIQQKSVQNDEPYFSDYVQLSYHPDAKDLIKTFFSIWKFEDETRDAAPFTDQPSLGDKSTSTKETYANLLGISPKYMTGKSYVFARYLKTVSTISLTAADFSEMNPAIIPPDFTGDNITKLFAEYGTHYVSGYEMGDMIYQVFVYDKDKTDDILHFPFDDRNFHSGMNSHLFKYYTKPINDYAKTGYCREAGKVLTASGDPVFKDILPKLNDKWFGIKESIFMFTKIKEGYKLMDMLTTKIPVKMYFKSIIDQLFPDDLLSKSNWNEVLFSTIFQKFGETSSPNFLAVTASRIQDVYDSFNPDLVTSTATNYVTINRMTFRLDDLMVLDPVYVTHVFIFADVLEISQTAKLKLPGSQNIYLVCREFVALSSGNNVPEIIVGSHGNADPVIKIIAKEFRGILKVTQANQGTHNTYANNFVYKTVRDPDLQDLYTVKTDNSKRLLYPNEQTVPELYDTKEKSLEANWLRASLVNSFELAVASVETIISVPASSNSAENTAGKTLEWITATLTQRSDDSTPFSVDLEMVLARALLIGKSQLTEYAKSRLIVPRLTYKQYKPLFDSLLTVVEQYQKKFEKVSSKIQQEKLKETTTNSLKELNKNVKSIGSFLVEQAEVNAKHQQDIANTQQSIHDLESDQIARKQAQAKQLLKEIVELQKSVKTTGDALVAAVKQYEKEQIISTVFGVVQVVGSLFTGGVAMGNIDKKLEGIVRVAEKIKNVMTIIEQVSKLYDLGINMRNDIGTINRALENIPSGQIDVDNFPTELEWEDFDTDVYSYTTPGGFLPGQVAGEALDFQRVAKRLSARGKKYIAIAANIANIKYKQIQIEMERDLAKRQAKRLGELKTKLNQNDLSDNDAKTTDLFELGNIIKMKENQVRSQLVQTFAIMDAAYQYHFLQKPTMIKRFDIVAIQRAAARQIRSKIKALENTLITKVKELDKPVEYTIPNVPVENLLSKGGYKVSIPLNALPFHEFSRVRILRMEVRADGISKSADDTAYIQATASGELFQDRDLDRNPESYSTFPTEYRTVYNIKTGNNILKPSNEFSDTYIEITPFDEWVFRMPKVTTNKGIKFDTVLTTLRIKFYLKVVFNPAPQDTNDGVSKRKLSDDIGGSKDNLLTQMNGRSLVREWDAIMAVSAERINQIWQKQHKDKTKPGFVNRLVTRKMFYDFRKTKTDFRLILDVGSPTIKFIENDEKRATLTIKISGVVEYWKRNKKTGLVNHYNITLDKKENYKVVATLDLKELRGSVTRASRVIIDLSSGIYDVDISKLNKFELDNARNEIHEYYTKKLKSGDYELSTITYEKKLTHPGLVPEKFYFKTGGMGFSNSGAGSLYIFFKTPRISPSKKADEFTKRDFISPLAIEKKIIPTGFDIALFINSRIIMNIIKQDLEKKFGFGVDARTTCVFGKSGANHVLTMTLPFDRYKDIQGFKFKIPGNSLRAKPINKGQKIQVHWVNSGFGVSVPYPSHKCSSGRGGSCWDTVEHKTVSFTTSYIKSFTPTIEKQTISYKEDASSGSAGSSVSGLTSWWLGTNFRRARSTVTSNVNRYMENLSFNFRKISSFAITQVVFPDSNVLQLTEVYIPGDMVILGKVTARVSGGARASVEKP